MGSSQATNSYAVSSAMRDSAVLRNARRPRWKRDQSRHSARAGSGSQSGRELPIDKLLLAVVLGLVLFGAVMVYSASAVLAQKEFDNQYYFLARQGLWAALGIIALVVGMCIDYRHYKHPAVIGLLLIV
ncbi:MAG TPA: FtsW/RodA/SpoVE family cell cycle protein, partial [Blastocatellia bacterium]|nr:FtsW/RodA/SpoVE family cell cycle protein [Blastocatellia bacterium]